MTKPAFIPPPPRLHPWQTARQSFERGFSKSGPAPSAAASVLLKRIGVDDSTFRFEPGVHTSTRCLRWPLVWLGRRRKQKQNIRTNRQNLRQQEQLEVRYFPLLDFDLCQHLPRDVPARSLQLCGQCRLAESALITNLADHWPARIAPSVRLVGMTSPFRIGIGRDRLRSFSGVGSRHGWHSRQMCRKKPLRLVLCNEHIS